MPQRHGEKMLNNLYPEYVEGNADDRGKILGRNKKSGAKGTRAIRSAMRNEPRSHAQTATGIGSSAMFSN